MLLILNKPLILEGAAIMPEVTLQEDYCEKFLFVLQ